MIKEGHVYTNSGEAGQECRALSSPAAHGFAENRAKGTVLTVQSWTQAQDLGTSCVGLIITMSLLCTQHVSRQFLRRRKHQTQSHSVQTRVGLCSNWRRGTAKLWAGQAPGKTECSVSNWSCSAILSPSKSMQAQPKHTKMRLYLQETRV